MSKYVFINRVLNMPWDLNMPTFLIWQGSQYVSVTMCSEYARICLDRALNTFWVLKMPGFSI